MNAKKTKVRQELFSLNEAATILGMDKRTIIAHSLLPIQRKGNRYVVDRRDIKNFLGRDF